MMGNSRQASEFGELITAAITHAEQRSDLQLQHDDVADVLPAHPRTGIPSAG
jgi:hypothetical protein